MRERIGHKKIRFDAKCRHLEVDRRPVQPGNICNWLRHPTHPRRCLGIQGRYCPHWRSPRNRDQQGSGGWMGIRYVLRHRQHERCLCSDETGKKVSSTSPPHPGRSSIGQAPRRAASRIAGGIGSWPQPPAIRLAALRGAWPMLDRPG